VIRYVRDEYGHDRVAAIITFGKLQARAVLRDVGRVLGMPYGQVDGICKLVPNNPANPVTLAKALGTEQLLKEQYEGDEEIKRLIDLALQLEGLYRNASTHAAGVVIGDRPVNRAAFVLHAAIHARRPEVIAAAHAHSPYGKAFSSLGKRLDPITQDCCSFYEDHCLIEADGGKVVLEESAGQVFADHFLQGKAAIHQNHGLFTVGDSVEAAAFWFIAMERCCQSHLLAAAAGTPLLIREEWAAYTHNHIGTPQAGRYGFASYWEDILASDPDLLD